MTDTYTYTPDMPRPLCPICGVPVEQSDTPEQPFTATCRNGHTHTFQLEKEEIEEPQFDSPYGSKWIIAVDINAQVTVLKAPNIHYGFFDSGKSAEMIGLPYESDAAPGVYEWVCSYYEHRDYESNVIDDYYFGVDKETLLYSVEDKERKND